MAILATITDFIAQQSPMEVIAVLSAILYPWLAARQNILCWPAAFISTSLYVVIFWEVSLPFHSLLNVYYLGMAILGWVKWKRPSSKENGTLPVTTRPLYIHLVAISALIMIGFVLTYLVDSTWLGVEKYLDAMITVFSVYTTYLMVNKVLENWLFWIVINSAAAYLFYNSGLVPTATMHVMYLMMSVYGFVKWRDDLAQQQTR